MTYRGYIKLWRKIQENPLYKERRRFNRNEAWIDLLLLANHKAVEITFGLRKIFLKAGDILSSQLSLAKRWRWGIASVKRFLEYLYDENQITFKTENKFTLISILNWSLYQARTENKTIPGRKPNGKQTFRNGVKIGKENLKQVIEEKNSKAEIKRKTKSPKAETNKNDTKNDKNIIDKEINSLSPKEIISSYKQTLFKQRGKTIRVNYGACGKLIKPLLKEDWTTKKFEELFNWFLNSKKGKEFNYELTVCLSTNSLNLFEEENKKENWQY